MLPALHEEYLRRCATPEEFSRETGVPLRLARQAVTAWHKLTRSRSSTGVYRDKLYAQLKGALAAIDRDIERKAKVLQTERTPWPESAPDLDEEDAGAPALERRREHPKAQVMKIDEAVRLVRGEK